MGVGCKAGKEQHIRRKCLWKLNTKSMRPRASPVPASDLVSQVRRSDFSAAMACRESWVGAADGKLNALRDYVDAKFAAVNDKICAQAVHNATSDAMLGCLNNQIATLMGLTKLVVPNSSVCPGWTTTAAA